MKVLAIDAATKISGVAVFDNDKLICFYKTNHVRRCL